MNQPSQFPPSVFYPPSPATTHRPQTMLSGQLTKILLLLIPLLSSIPPVKPQPSPPPDEFQYAKFSPSMAIIVIVLVAALFFMGFFSIYIRRWSNDGGTSAGGGLSIRRAGRLAAASRGLDAGILETFPTFSYSTVKGLKIGKGALECAVCLNEFADDETIRLIPKCDHVFHVECIDAWLEHHVTCPVCRSNLVHTSSESTQRGSELGLGSADNANNNQTTTVTGGREEGRTDVTIPVDRTPVLSRVKSATPYRPARSKSVNRNPLFDKFRSHSTGHSLVQIGEDTERFTLRLPEEVRKEVISNALLNRSGSTVRLAGEVSGRKGYRTGEGSSKGKSYRRMGSLDRSVFTRAPSFLSRAFSGRSQKANGAASTSATATSDTVPLNNIGPKSDEVGSKGGGSGRPPV